MTPPPLQRRILYRKEGLRNLLACLAEGGAKKPIPVKLKAVQAKPRKARLGADREQANREAFVT
jgi:hypothetical protein